MLVVLVHGVVPTPGRSRTRAPACERRAARDKRGGRGQSYVYVVRARAPRQPVRWFTITVVEIVLICGFLLCGFAVERLHLRLGPATRVQDRHGSRVTVQSVHRRPSRSTDSVYYREIITLTTNSCTCTL